MSQIQYQKSHNHFGTIGRLSEQISSINPSPLDRSRDLFYKRDANAYQQKELNSSNVSRSLSKCPTQKGVCQPLNSEYFNSNPNVHTSALASFRPQSVRADEKREI